MNHTEAATQITIAILEKVSTMQPEGKTPEQLKEFAAKTYQEIYAAVHLSKCSISQAIIHRVKP